MLSLDQNLQAEEHDPEKGEELKKRNAKEPEAKQHLIQEAKQSEKKDRVMLLYSAKDTAHNNAVALKAIMERG